MDRKSRFGPILLFLLLLGPAPALAAPKSVDAKRVFPYLEAYLKLPPAERSHFTVAYRFRSGEQPLTAPMWLVDGQTRSPDPVKDGRPARLPTLAELGRAKAEFGLDAATKLSVNLGMEPLATSAAELDARELAKAVAQAAVGARKSAGVMGFLAPKVTRVLFEGVGGGEVRFADGRRAPLPLDKGQPVFEPAAFPGAMSLRFPKPPSRLQLD